jgi:hypothetical protein
MTTEILDIIMRLVAAGSLGACIVFERRIQRGRVTPNEAEAEAARLGLAPLLAHPDPADFDARTEPYWTIGMVLTWIMTLDTECVREAWEKWREAKQFWSCKKWQVPGGLVYEGCFIEQVGPFGIMGLHAFQIWRRDADKLKMAWQVAWEQLSAALKRDELQAYGVPESGGERALILPFHWQDLGLYENKKGRLAVRVKPGLSAGYEDVVLASDRVRALWPQTKPSEEEKCVTTGRHSRRKRCVSWTRRATSISTLIRRGLRLFLSGECFRGATRNGVRRPPCPRCGSMSSPA